MTHLQKTLINRPYGTGRVLSLFSRHFVPGYPRFNPSGINATSLRFCAKSRTPMSAYRILPRRRLAPVGGFHAKDA
jgi:hypothetical protein